MVDADTTVVDAGTELALEDLSTGIFDRRFSLGIGFDCEDDLVAFFEDDDDDDLAASICEEEEEVEEEEEEDG